MPIEHMDMKHPKIIVAGIGPGNESDITPAVISALQESDVVVGYKYYFQFVIPYLHPSTTCIDTGMKRERARAEQAFELAEQGKTVCVISSGDAGIYGMTPLVYEMKRERNSNVEIVSLPGISAFQKAASLLGAPVGHDFCVISLSDLMTPWERIERRITAAAAADFVTAVYNPKSEGRYWQLYRLKELFLQEGRSPETPVGYVRQAGRPEQAVHITTLGDFNPEEVDMFTVVLIGNSQSYEWNGAFITPRGYYRDTNTEATGIGQDIMIRSFRTIEKELKNKHIPLDHKWALLHAIHTTADFEMEHLLHTDEGAVASLYQVIEKGGIKTIVTDVTMAASGIRKGALQRLGIEVKCYLGDPRTATMAAEKGITRTQAGIRLAVEEHPDAFFVFGNAPTALMELCDLIRKGYVRQAGRPEQAVHITTLGDFNPEEVDMFTVVLIGNSQSYEWNGAFITPRGYYRDTNTEATGIGQDIMIRSFRTIEKELKNKHIPLDHKWALLHAIHTTADFEMEHLLHTDEGAVASLYQVIEKGGIKTIVTDVTMAASGIRKGALQRLGIEVKCYLGDPRTATMAAEKGITRTQAGIRLAVEEHPDAFFVFGNAPTALMELCDLIRKGKAHPAGIVAAPVGFVHVQESKHMVKPFTEIPKIIVEGRKGGSNLAATLVNSVLCYNDAEQLRPGRDV